MMGICIQFVRANIQNNTFTPMKIDLNFDNAYIV